MVAPLGAVGSLARAASICPPGRCARGTLRAIGAAAPKSSAVLWDRSGE